MNRLKISTEKWLFGLPFTLLLLVIIFTGFNGLYGQDGHEYYRYSSVLSEYLRGNADNENFYWTVLYPLIGALFSFLTGHSPFSLQIISVLAFTFSLVFLFKSLKSESSNPFLLVFLIIGFLVSPTNFKSAMQVMSDPLATFFVVSSIYLFSQFLKQPGSRRLIILAASIILATYTRYQMAVLLFPMALSAVVIAIQSRLYKGMLASLVVLAILSLPEWWLSPSLQDNIQSNYYLGAWSLKNMWSSSFLTVDGTLNFNMPNFIFNSGVFWHPSFFMLLPLSVFWLRKGDFTKFEIVLFIGLMAYLLLLSGLPFQNNRMLLPAFPMALVILNKSFTRGMKWLWYKWKRLSLVGLVGFFLLQIAFTVYLSRIFVERNQLEQEVSAYLRTVSADNIYAFDLDVSMGTYLPEKEVKNLLAETYKFEEGDLIVFNQAVYEKSWSKSRIADNLKLLRAEFDMETLRSFNQGWVLFKLVHNQ